MKIIRVAKRLLSRRVTILHSLLLAAAVLGLIVWLLGGDVRWLVLPTAAIAGGILLLGVQLQFSVDSVQTLKNNSQRRHAALKASNERLAAQSERLITASGTRGDSLERQFKALSQVLLKVESSLESDPREQEISGIRRGLDRMAAGHQILGDQYRFRFAELIDLYQDQSDRQQAFELRLAELVRESVESLRDELSNDDKLVDGIEPFESNPEINLEAEESKAPNAAGIEKILETVWSSLQNHIWLRDLYSRSGSIAPRHFLSSPKNMKAGAFLGSSEKLLIDWGIDSLTFHLAEQRSRKGRATVAVESDERLADLAAQALGGSLRTVSTATLATQELGYELAGLIQEPAGMLVSQRLEGQDLERFAAVLGSLHHVDSVYLTATMTNDGEPTAEVLVGAGFQHNDADENGDVDRAGLELWQRVN